ncbi:MAG: hypothetical protein P8I55_09320 [Crocinitomix sp.]|nr:hypothetical protein [Crocinitomix sp.]
MKQLFFIVILILGVTSLQAQNELVNIHLSKSVMHGGTSDSGSSIGLAYTFVACKTIHLPNILFEGEKLVMQPTDTLIIRFISFRPYQDNHDYGAGEKPKPKKSFEAYFRSGACRISVNMEEEFITADTYLYKKKEYVAKRKTEIDESQEHAAP